MSRLVPKNNILDPSHLQTLFNFCYGKLITHNPAIRVITHILGEIDYHS
jgi:hypothetical protein